MNSGTRSAILLGSLVQQHGMYASLHAAAQSLASDMNATLGVLCEAANSVGGYVAKAAGSCHLGALVTTARKAYVLLNVEPDLDCANPRLVCESLGKAGLVVALSSFKSGVQRHANVLLPIAPFSETAGTFVNMEGRVQSFTAAVMPLGSSRPGWKVIRALGSLLGLRGFGFDTAEAVRNECLQSGEVRALLSNRINLEVSGVPEAKSVVPQAGGLERIADVPIYFTDSLVRHADSLQKTADAEVPRAWMNRSVLSRIGLSEGVRVVVRQDGGEASLVAALDDRLPDDCVRISAGHPATAHLGPMSGSVTVECLLAQQVA